MEADSTSRVKNLDGEWMLKPENFQLLCRVFFVPDIDLLASRINTQLSNYDFWNLDPSAFSTNAFAIGWDDMNLYIFPPVRIIGRMLKKLKEDKATLLAILPLRPTQVWFPSAFQLLADTPFSLPHYSLILPQDPYRIHPRAGKLTTMLLSGDPLRTTAFRQTNVWQPRFLLKSWRNGTVTKYGSHLQRWMSVCLSGKVDQFRPSVRFMLDFLLQKIQ